MSTAVATFPHWSLPLSPRKTDTPTSIEAKFPWLKPVEAIRAEMPEHPTSDDYAKFYGSVLVVYQQQRAEFLRYMTKPPTPMPLWAKFHSVALVVQAIAIAELYIRAFLRH
jgi:hypothetical protein